MPKPLEPVSSDRHAEEALDRLLRSARWPELSPQVLGQLEGRLEQALQPTAGEQARASRWWAAVAGVAAAAGVLLGGSLWWNWHAAQRRLLVRQEVAAIKPDEPVSVREDRLHTLLELPGRAPTALELAFVRAIAPPTRAEAVSPVQQVEEAVATLAEGRRSVSGALRTLARVEPRTRDELLLNLVLEEEMEPARRNAATHLLDLTANATTRWRLVLAAEQYEAETDTWSLRPHVVDAVAWLLPAASLRQGLATGDTGGRDRVLLAALAQSHDPAAGAALEAAAQMLPAETRQAVATACSGAPGVLGLVALLDDPRVERRESAASLLGNSTDPAVYDAVSRRLANGGQRREAMLVLLQSQAPQARQLLDRAQGDPALAALAKSLRLQLETEPADNQAVIQIP